MLTLKLAVTINSSAMLLTTPRCLSPPGSLTKSYWGSWACINQDRVGENQGQECPLYQKNKEQLLSLDNISTFWCPGLDHLSILTLEKGWHHGRQDQNINLDQLMGC